MKKSMLCLLLILTITGTALAFKEPPHVMVSGTGSIEVVPDEMFWTLRVENHGPQIKPLAKDHNEIIARLIDSLEQIDIPEDEIQTTRMQMGERWDHKNGRRIRAGFFCASTISFKLMDFNKYQSLWQELAGFKGMNIQNVAYGYSKKTETRNKARTMAVMAAQKKAKAMAKALKCDIGPPLLIEDIQGGQDIYRSNMVMEKGFTAAGNSGKSYAQGTIQIETRVRAAFSLNCKN